MAMDKSARSKVEKAVVIEDKTAVEQMRLIQQLDEEDGKPFFA